MALTDADKNYLEKTFVKKEELKAELSGLATKADLGSLATKAELSGLATKTELKGLATKTELKALATKADLKTLATKDELKTLATKAELGETNDNLRRLGLIMEHGFDELRGILGDILDWVKEVPVQRQRLDDHDLQIRQLNRTVYGYDSSLE